MRIIAIVLMMCLLTGCRAVAPEQPVQEKPPVQEQQIVTPVPEAEEPKEEMFTYLVDMAVCSDEAKAEDGTVLANYRAVYPVLSVCREDGTPVETAETEKEQAALEITEVFNEKFKDWAEGHGFEEMTVMAEEQFAWYQMEGMDWYSGYSVELLCDVYQTEQLISVTGGYYAYTGGAHPNTALLAWNFDLTDGTFFGPELLSDQEDFQEIVSEKLEVLAQEVALGYGSKAEEFFWEDYATILDSWANYTVSFDETGMTVAFSPYELASYAAGPQEFYLTYEWLTPYLGEYGCRVLGLAEAAGA